MLEVSAQTKHARNFEKIVKYISNVFECSLQITWKIVAYFHYTECAKKQKKITEAYREN